MEGLGLKFPNRPIACLNTKCFWNENKFCLGTIANLDENGRCIIQDWHNQYDKEECDQEIVEEVCKSFNIKRSTAETNQWKAEYDCYTCLHNDHGECEFKVRPIITSQGRCCRHEV